MSRADGVLFERISVARDHEILTEALRHGRGRISLLELKDSLGLEEAAGRVFRRGGEAATAASLQREREMADAVNRGIGRFEPLGRDREFVASDRLNPEQKSAVEAFLHCRDRAVNIRGAAGTGKTAILQELNQGLSGAGRVVFAVAPTTSAVEELRKVGFDDAVTIERLLQDPSLHRSVQGNVLIADEAGMLSARQMSATPSPPSGATTRRFQSRSECSRANSRESASSSPMRFTAMRNASSSVSPASTSAPAWLRR